MGNNKSIHKASKNKLQTNTPNTIIPPEKTTSIFLIDQQALPAEWGTEGVWIYTRRFFGFEKESENEVRKKQQKISNFVPGCHQYAIGSSKKKFQLLTLGNEAKEATLLIENLYRSYRLLSLWKNAVGKIIERQKRESLQRQMLLDEANALQQFRSLLVQGFQCHKLFGSHKLKPVVLRVILKPRRLECYLTWKPSKKLQAKIHLHSIESVQAISKNLNNLIHSNAEVSHRRGFVVNIPSAPRGQLVFQSVSSQQRDLLVKGFQKCLEFIRSATGRIDDQGVLRQQSRQQSLLFFQEECKKIDDIENDKQDHELEEDEEEEAAAVGDERFMEENSIKLVKYYNTRFDMFPTELDSNPKQAKEQLLQEEEACLADVFQRCVENQQKQNVDE